MSMKGSTHDPPTTRSTTMSMYGANPEQLAALGSTMHRQVEPIRSVIGTVSGVLGSTTWMGPARDRFEDQWNSQFRIALERLIGAFETAGQDCIQRAADLQAVMGAR
jgi:uncharacterized protein YukE